MSSERPLPSRKGDDTPVEETLRTAIEKATGVSAAIKSIQLYYIRQTNGDVDGHKVVYYFEPEFIYAIDIGKPRLALVTLPYQVPTIKEGWDYRTIGRGDGEFPEFSEAAVFSGAGYKEVDILYGAAPGELLIGAEEGVSEDKLRAALAGYVTDLTNEGIYYRCKVKPFDEPAVAAAIMAEVDAVRYAELNGQIRDVSGPWWVDRVL